MIGKTLGSYQIISLLGEGGMGQVYRARDTKLNRDVALKILPDRLAADAERLARFRREAQVLASLNHPNIAAIYGVEEWQSHQALVMELVPGRTLAEIINAEGALGADIAVPVASQIADALEAAHEAGIIHRDLKPANIKRRDDDVVKVLDFGLARALESAGSGASAATSSSPTLVSPAVTQPGVVLGTAGYMSPEQARGRMADKRADIWAFGVVLFEMLTGRRLFAGETVTEVISAVIKDAPRLDALPAETPPAVRHLLARCLERDPKLRLRDIGEARIMLRTALSPDDPLNREAAQRPDESARPGPNIARRVLVGVSALALAGLAALAAWRVKPDATTVPVRRFDLPSAMADTTDAGLAPDGSRIVYLMDGHLYVHTLQTGRTTDLGVVPPSAAGVFWSPDSQTIGYGADSTIRTVPATGGVPFTVCTVPASGRIMGGLWQDDGTILFPVWRDSVYRVAATGGTPALRVAIDPKTEIDFHVITSLPGDRFVVTTHLRGEDGSRADLVDGDRRTPLSNDPNIANVLFQPPDRLLFLRIRTNQGVWTAPFDGRTVDFTKAVLVEPGARFFDVAPDGTLLASLPAKVRRELVWVARSGTVTPLPGAPFEWAAAGPVIALSPENRRAVLSTRSAERKDEFVVRDLDSGRDTRVPLPAASTGVASSTMVTWTPSGRLLYAAGGIEASKIYDWPADGSANGRELVNGFAARMAGDGKDLLFTRDSRGQVPLFRAPVQPNGGVGQAVPVFPDNPSVRWFDVSADGRLLAFTSTDPVTAQINLFVATYPDLRERRQVTSEGGTQPRFSRDGRELFFLSGVRTPDGLMRGHLSVVSIKTAPLTVGAPTVLLKEGDADRAGDRPPTLGGFDIGSDGRLLMTRIVPTAPGDEARIVIVQNWPAAIRK